MTWGFDHGRMWTFRSLPPLLTSRRCSIHIHTYIHTYIHIYIYNIYIYIYNIIIIIIVIIIVIILYYIILSVSMMRRKHVPIKRV